MARRPTVADEEAADAVAEHEKRIFSRLTGIDGLAREAESAPTLLQVLAGGPMEVAALLDVAVRLAHTVAAMHRRSVLHLNITPSNIVLSGPQRMPVLVGFRRATTFAEERPGFTHVREIRGDLLYLAPEQTGRTGRRVDLRSDLYALGAALYESATGRPPFEAKDPLQQLRDNLTLQPTAPQHWRSDLPADLQRIILRLLEKEPEARYQSAEGLAHDLTELQLRLSQGATEPIRLGERDFPLQLCAPARLVGRAAEIEALRHALDEVVEGQARIVLVSGGPGVGKTSLINELRPMVTARHGLFVSGKFDQYRDDAAAAVTQALRALGRLLLAEPQAQLVKQRRRILSALGPHAGLVCTMPEFALLLGPQPEVAAAAPAQAEARLLTTMISLLRCVVSAQRPLVLFLDDLQWAGALSVRFIEAVLDAVDLSGLLLVCSYRDSEVDGTHPLAMLLSRRSGRSDWVRLHLVNLPPKDLGELLREMLRLPQEQTASLAQAVARHTAGNPYETVELLNALRREGALQPGPVGWQWNAEALRRYVGQSGVLDLLAQRCARLPRPTRYLLEAMACLGGQVPTSLLRAATGLSAADLDEHLAPALEDGLLMIEPGDDAVLRMRHDRVQQAVYGAFDPAQGSALHLALARRLASKPDLAAHAVPQYLAGVDEIRDASECRSVAQMFRDAALRMKSAANFPASERLLAAARSLVDRLPSLTRLDESLRATLEIDHVIVLCSLARFEDADALYEVIEGRGAPVCEWVDAACAQLDGLSSRSRYADVIQLGCGLLRRLGVEVPDDFAAADIEEKLASLGRWVDQLEIGLDARPYTGDSDSLAAAKLIQRLSYSGFFYDWRAMAWFILEAQAIWQQHGPVPVLVPVLASAGAVTATLIQDYRTGYYCSLHAVEVSRSRGWEAATAEGLLLHGGHSSHWFDSAEETERKLRMAAEGLQRQGMLLPVCFALRARTSVQLDCSPSIQAWAEGVEGCMALSLRLRFDYGVAMMATERELICGLRGDEDSPAPSDEESHAALERQSKQSAVGLNLHYGHALRDAIFGDAQALAANAAVAFGFAKALPSNRAAQARLLQALALAQQARAAEPARRASLLSELDAECEWLAARAEDCPDNYRHQLRWIEAERSWAMDDFGAAAQSFDAAMREADSRRRPWHAALITERAGLFHLQHGLARSGEYFIERARDLYMAWGAAAKVRQLERAYGFLANASPPPPAAAGAGAVDAIDTLAILRASQALSSETSLARLQARVADVMRALTGAIAVHLVLRDEEGGDWTFPQTQGDPESRITVDEAGRQGLLPLSAFRYAERTCALLLLDDAKGDDRFGRDPYFADCNHCSLLIAPILNQGAMCAMLILENRRSRGAFSGERLDAVALIAGQLAVSLENARLYDRLEQRVNDQTLALVDAARRAGMAQIATNVLHNVGNVLNSVNVSARWLSARIQNSRSSRVVDLAGLVESGAADPARFFATDARARQIPLYLRELGAALTAERGELLDELQRLVASVDHIKNVVAMQQSYAGESAMWKAVDLAELADDALRMQEDALLRHRVVVEKRYTRTDPVAVDKTRVMQILLNLVENAAQAMEHVPGDRVLTIAVRRDDSHATVTVGDRGCGIDKDSLGKVFSHGFTTKKHGHGFGLHSCAVAALEMGGTLTVASGGVGAGSTFTLRIPLDAGASADAMSR